MLVLSSYCTPDNNTQTVCIYIHVVVKMEYNYILLFISEWSLVDQAREYDSQLISILGVGLICDLMVEMRKTAYGMT